MLELSEDQVGQANHDFQDVQQSGDPLPLRRLGRLRLLRLLRSGIRRRHGYRTPLFARVRAFGAGIALFFRHKQISQSNKENEQFEGRVSEGGACSR